MVFRGSGFERELPKRLLAPRFSNDFLPNFSMNRYESARWNSRFEFHHTAIPIQLSPDRCERKELLPFDRGGLDQTKSLQDSSRIKNTNKRNSSCNDFSDHDFSPHLPSVKGANDNSQRDAEITRSLSLLRLQQ